MCVEGGFGVAACTGYCCLRIPYARSGRFRGRDRVAFCKYRMDKLSAALHSL